ncbi:hypothetical protein ACFL1Q_00395 [Patescibacteria group bacterium]
MSKRKRFLITSLILSLGFVGIQFLDNSLRFWAIGLLGLTTLVTFTWSLWEGLSLNMTLLALILPTIFTLGVGIFWFLLPANIFARLPVVIFYGVGIYVLCLTMNIYTVSAIRTIALFRAARGVGFVLSLITFFLVYDTILSLRTSLPVTLSLVSLLSLPLYVQGFWSVTLEKEFNKDILITSSVAALIMGEVTTALYFWPVTVVVGSLFLTVVVYVILGLGQARLEERFFSQTVREYLIVGLFVFIGMFLATHWGG